MENDQDHFNVLRKIKENPNSTQRGLTESLGFSLGKLNYFYILTPNGISEKAKLTVNLMKRKMQEYDELKNELDD